VLSTLAYAILFLVLSGLAGAALANALALAVTAVGNTAANRAFTFGVRGRKRVVLHHVRGALVFVLTLALTSGALAVLHGLDPAPRRGIELFVLVAASVTATIARYTALRTWVFTRSTSSVGRHDPRLLPSSRRAG
jgi:putative flippase GtrA